MFCFFVKRHWSVWFSLLFCVSYWCSMPRFINSLELVKCWHLNSFILFSFINWNNYIRRCFSSSTIWLLSLFRKVRINIWFFPFVDTIFKLMNWFPVILRWWPIHLISFLFKIPLWCRGFQHSWQVTSIMVLILTEAQTVPSLADRSLLKLTPEYFWSDLISLW